MVTITQYRQNALKLNCFKLLVLSGQQNINKKYLSKRAELFRLRCFLNRWQGRYLLAQDYKMIRAEQFYERRLIANGLLSFMLNVKYNGLK